MENDNPTRILRNEILVPSETVLLPVGIQKPGESVRYREVVVDEICGVDEENLAKAKVRKSPGSVVTTLLRRCVQEIPGLMEPKKKEISLARKEFVCDWMTQIDRDFLLVNILVLSGHDETEVRAYCDDCDEALSEKVKYSDLKVYDWPEDAPLHFKETLPKGFRDRKGEVHRDFEYKFPTGHIQEMVLKQARGNQGKASTLMIASCMSSLGTMGQPDSEQAARFKKADRDFIGNAGLKILPGLDLIRTVECDICGREFRRAVDLSGFFSQD